MKKLFATILAVLMLLTLLAACGRETAVSVGTLKGPTGMGMAKLIDDGEYAVTLAGAPDELTAKFISGELNIVCVPINLASVLYNKLQGDVEMLAVNTLGVLYVIDTGDTVQSIADLDGARIAATGQASTPEYVLNYLLNDAGVTAEIEYYAEHSDLAALLASGEEGVGMLPEPNVTAVLMKNFAARVALDLTELWKTATGTELVQGCVIVRKSWHADNEKAVAKFLENYAASVEYTVSEPAAAAVLMETEGIVGSAALGEAAIERCNIVCITGDDMRASAEAMLQVLYDAAPASVGGTLPDSDFYA